MSRDIAIRPLDAQAFAPFGEVLAATGAADALINQGLCRRFHDRAGLEFGLGRAGISIFDAMPRSLPHRLDMMERHPLGSQAFLPMHGHHWLVIVAPDDDGAPGRPMALRAAPGQGVNICRNVWHGVLCPLSAPGLFAVIDRIAPEGEAAGANLEEYWPADPWTVTG